MELIAGISCIIEGGLACIALFWGHRATKQIGIDNSCDEHEYKLLKKYVRLMMGTFGLMIVYVMVLAIYVLVK